MTILLYWFAEMLIRTSLARCSALLELPARDVDRVGLCRHGVDRVDLCHRDVDRYRSHGVDPCLRVACALAQHNPLASR